MKRQRTTQRQRNKSVTQSPRKARPTGLFEFQWLVATTRYRWVDVAVLGPMLTDGLPKGLLGYGGHSELGRSYAPFRDTPALFRQFAGLKPTKESIADFAQSYGLLGGGCSQVVKLGNRSDEVMEVI